MFHCHKPIRPGRSGKTGAEGALPTRKDFVRVEHKRGLGLGGVGRPHGFRPAT